MEVEHEGKTSLLDEFAEVDHVVEILTDGGIVIVEARRGIHKETHALGIPPHCLALQILQHVGNLRTLLIVVGHVVFLVLG